MTDFINPVFQHEKLMSFLMLKTRPSSMRQTTIAIGFQFHEPNNVVSLHENVIIGSSFRELDYVKNYSRQSCILQIPLRLLHVNLFTDSLIDWRNILFFFYAISFEEEQDSIKFF